MSASAVSQIIKVNESSEYLEAIETYSKNPVILHAAQTVSTKISAYIRAIITDGQKQNQNSESPLKLISFKIKASDQKTDLKYRFSINDENYKQIIVKNLTFAIDALSPEKRTQFEQIWLLASEIIPKNHKQLPFFLTVAEGLQIHNWRDSQVFRSIVYTTTLEI